jgi:hypothetical protein
VVSSEWGVGLRMHIIFRIEFKLSCLYLSKSVFIHCIEFKEIAELAYWYYEGSQTVRKNGEQKQ